MTDTPDFITAAQAYEARGWRVIPLHRVGPDGRTCSCHRGGNCPSKGKHPKDNEWQRAPRMSTADIHATWDDPRPPNIGVATGVDSGIWVLDIDPKGGGMESMAALVAEHGRLPETFTAETGSGGYHYVFTLPDFEVLNDQSGHVAPGIDVRGKGGQIVAAPSRTDKGVYTVIRDVSPVPAPDWLLALVRKEDRSDLPVITAEDLPKPDDMDEATWKRCSAYAQRAIDGELGRLDAMKAAATPNPSDYRGEPWNGTTFEVSATLIEFANSPWCSYSTGQALRDVLEHAPRDREFDDYVVRRTFDSAREKVGPKARQMPEDRHQDVDAMFSGPDVRNPSEGGEAPANPVAQHNPARYFGGDKGTTPLHSEMAKGVTELGPIGWGKDDDWWRYADGVWTPDKWVVQHRLIDITTPLYKKDYVGTVNDYVQRHAIPITGDPLEEMMNFRNGMLAWNDDILVDHDPAYASTTQFGCDWDPEAECPKFEAWLSDTLHPDYVPLVWEMIGYLMLSGNPKHHAFMLFGKGGSGKSTLLRTIEALLGPDNIAAETLEDLNGNRFRTASLFGKIANIAGDIDATFQENTAAFKRITGQDRITAEHKGKTPFRFVCWAVPIFSANKIPGSADVTDGYLRRWILVKFDHGIPADQRIDNLEHQWLDELPGIAAKGVRSLRALMARGHFEFEGEARKGQDEFAETIDQVRRWFSSGLATVAPDVSTILPRLYENYTRWAERSGQTKAVGAQEFSHRLEAMGYDTVRIGGEIYHNGISVPETVTRSVTPENFFGANREV